MSVVIKITFWTMRVMTKQKKVTKMRKNLKQGATNLTNREKYGEEKITSDLNSWSEAGLITFGGLIENREKSKQGAVFYILFLC